MMQSELDRILVVAHELSRIGWTEAVFVGGSVVGLLLTDQAAPKPRSTIDVDVVVDVASRVSYARLERQLRDQGFTPAPEGPLCRWMVKGVQVDIMPMEEAILGFSNRWYKDLQDNSHVREIAPGRSIRLVSAPYLLATKLEAFLNRGGKDLWMSHDITDIISLVDGRPELLDELAQAPVSARLFVKKTLKGLLAAGLGDSIEAHLPADPFSEARAAIVVERIIQLASDSNES